MTRTEKQELLLKKFEELANEIFPNDENVEYLLAISDYVDGVDKFYCNSCPRCMLLTIETSLDANNIKHNSEELDSSTSDKVH